MNEIVKKELEDIERRLEQGERWFDSHSEVNSKDWEKAFDLFRSLIEKKAALLNPPPKQLELESEG